MKVYQKFVLYLIVFEAAFLLTSCGYQIRYPLNQRNITIAQKPIPLNVQVAQFTDARDLIERQKDARKQKGDPDLADYTYDREFRGQVAHEITQMLTQHLNFARAFTPAIQMTPLWTHQLSDSRLDSLKQRGVDAVLTGEIGHFYGYYDRNVGRQLLYAVPLGVLSGMLLSWTTTSGNYQMTYYWYGPGLVLGYYLESLHQRQIEQRAQLNARLISTSTYQVLWQQNLDVFVGGKRKMPGIDTEQRKYQVAVYSLRDAVNQLVASLAQQSDFILQNKDQFIVDYPQEPTQPTTPDLQKPGSGPQLDLSRPLPEAKNFEFGLLGGLNLANFSGKDAKDLQSRTGFACGAFLTWHLNRQFAIQPEVFYTVKGAKYDQDVSYGAGDIVAHIQSSTQLNYLDIPVLGIFSPVANLKLFAGPSLNIFLNGKSEAEFQTSGMGINISDKSSYDIKSDDVNNPELSLVAGGAYEIGRINLGVRYSMGLTNHPKTKDKKVDLKNRVLQFMLGFAIL